MTTPKLLIAALACGLSLTASAQQSKVVSAYNYLGLNQLDKAKENIDAAALNPDTKDRAKTWYYRALVYQSLFKKSVEDKQPNMAYFDTAFACVKHANTFKKNDYQDELAAMKPVFIFQYSTFGIDAFRKKDYPAATQYFERVVELEPKDTFGIQNTALAAYQGKNYLKADQYFDLMAKYKYDDPETFQLWAQSRQEQKDTAGALTILDKGRQRYPKSAAIMNDAINIFIRTHRFKDASTMIDAAIAQQPKNAQLKFMQGALAEGEKNFAKAESSYKQAIADSSSYFDANYNLGAIYYNNGADLMRKANDIPTNRQKEYEMAKAAAREELKKALPFMEAAIAIKKDDYDTANSLYQIYEQLGNQAKSKEYKSIRDGLK